MKKFFFLYILNLIIFKNSSGGAIQGYPTTAPTSSQRKRSADVLHNNNQNDFISNNCNIFSTKFLNPTIFFAVSLINYLDDSNTILSNLLNAACGNDALSQGIISIFL